MKKNTQHIKMSVTKRKLMEFIFEDKKTLKYKKILKLKDSNNNNNKNNIVNIIPNKSENELLKDKDQNKNFRTLNEDLNYQKNSTKFLNEQNNNNILTNHNNNFEDNFNKNSANYLKEYKYNNYISNKNLSLNRLNFSLFKQNPNKKSNEKGNLTFINIKNNKYCSFDESIRKNKKNNTNQNKNKSRIFPYYYFLLDIIFDNLINPKKFFCISKNYFLLFNFMCKIYDISTHILFFKQFNLINKFFKHKKIEENEINNSLFSKRININNNQIMNKIDTDLNKISNYDIFL
jgi:hypothetical protein